MHIITLLTSLNIFPFNVLHHFTAFRFSRDGNTGTASTATKDKSQQEISKSDTAGIDGSRIGNGKNEETYNGKRAGSGIDNDRNDNGRNERSETSNGKYEGTNSNLRSDSGVDGNLIIMF